MKFDIDRLYSLLPAIHRVRDHQLVGDSSETPPLRALLTIIAEEIEHIEENIDQLYDDYFIETCSEWVIPYIGELIGNTPLIPINDENFSNRSEVANTIAYRRRKGTLAIIEQLARDITNWDANVVEYFKLLATTQYLNHLRPENVVTPHLKQWETLEFVHTPFDSIPRSADVRNISNRRGKYNIPNIGIYLWRVFASFREDSTAFQRDDLKYTFHPLGVNTRLYNFPKSEESITQLASAQNMPTPFTRRLLKEYLSEHYGEGRDILIQIEDTEIIENQICIGDLSSWDDATIVPPADTVVIDPILGRIQFGNDFQGDLSPSNVNVWYNYGKLFQFGGGEYSRNLSFSDFENVIRVSQDAGIADFASIQDAIDQAEIDGVHTVIEILDNKSYLGSLSADISQGQTIEIRSTQGKQATLLLSGSFLISGGNSSELILNGLKIDGEIVVENTSKLEKLTISHSTILPHLSENRIQLATGTHLSVENSIVCGIVTAADSSILLENSILDVNERNEKAITGTENEQAELTIINSTILGEIEVKMVHLIENSILLSKLETQFLQKGCVRFTYLSLDSSSPSKYNCYPTEKNSSLKPLFHSLDYGSAHYFQLLLENDKSFLEGADDSSEIGVYHNLYRPQKEKNLRSRLNEYLRFGMEAGIFFAS